MTTPKMTKPGQEALKFGLQAAGFQAAVLDNDLPTVQTMLDEGFPVDMVLPLRKTALFLAVRSGADMIGLLLRAGANVNWTSPQDETPLLHAVDIRRPDMVRVLLDAGATQDSALRKAALWEAVGRGDTESVGALIKAGGSLRLVNKDGTTLLHRAMGNGHLDVARQLLAAGMSPNIRDYAGQTPLHYAVLLDSEFAATLQEYGVDIHATDKKGETALFAAARRVLCIEVFDALVAMGANPRARNRKEQSLFDVALEEKQGAMALLTLTHVPEHTPAGADLDAALVEAVRMGSIRLVEHLADLGADLAQKPGGRTLVQIAPRDSDDMKQLLRALKLGGSVTEAISDGHKIRPPEEAGSAPAIQRHSRAMAL